MDLSRDEEIEHGTPQKRWFRTYEVIDNDEKRQARPAFKRRGV
jgi:hypothetical protein